ncbi:uncharacterized protein PAC_06052 [Phialocephala subalpina]|uniref:Uncharacterized protein n=1 Tax=Phialocephala subalpina TaxID=576137 RepID=A0A1L7WTQ7_9HELO|nr:uncharacterized protein PAC_06052 [Phialocephala subalpina]
MMFATTIMALVGLSALPMALAGVAPLPKGLSVRTEASLPYPLGVMTVTGTVGGHEIQLNGTIQDVYAQVKKAHPDFDAGALVNAHKLAIREDEDGLVGRNKIQPGLCCPFAGQNWNWADAGRIQEGVQYLDHVQALCGVGPRSCVRVSCSWRSAIYLCNDNDYGITPNCGYIGSYASDLINQCVLYNPIGQGYVCGQEFDTDRYNVIVREDSC